MSGLPFVNQVGLSLSSTRPNAFKASSCFLKAIFDIIDVPGIARSAISRNQVPDFVDVAPARVKAVPSSNDCIGSISRPDCSSGTA